MSKENNGVTFYRGVIKTSTKKEAKTHWRSSWKIAKEAAKKLAKNHHFEENEIESITVIDRNGQKCP